MAEDSEEHDRILLSVAVGRWRSMFHWIWVEEGNRKPVSWNRSCSRCYSHRPFYLFSGEEIK